MTHSDISPTNGLDLDERVALEHFYGKDQEEAVALFEENFGYYAEDLPYMGHEAFLYYIGSVRSYLERHEDEFDPSDYVSTAYDLLCVFECRRILSPSWQQELSEDFLWIIDFIKKHLLQIVQNDDSWVVDPMLASEKKIMSLIRRWSKWEYLAE